MIYIKGDTDKQPLAFVMRSKDDSQLVHLYKFAQGAPFYVVSLDDIVGIVTVVADPIVKVVGMWGHSAAPDEVAHFVGLCAAYGKWVFCFGVCENGYPKHPKMAFYTNPSTKWVMP